MGMYYNPGSKCKKNLQSWSLKPDQRFFKFFIVDESVSGIVFPPDILQPTNQSIQIAYTFQQSQNRMFQRSQMIKIALFWHWLNITTK